MRREVLASRVHVFLLAGVCVVLLAVNSVLAMMLLGATFENSVHATLLPQISSNDDFIMPRPLVTQATSLEQRYFLTRSLIKEYINARYRVTGSGADANECIFLRAPVPLDCPVLAAPSVNFDGSWTDAFRSLIDPFGEERVEINQLRMAGATRSVRFLSEPRLHRDRWVVDVEFIIRDRGVWDVESARRERFEVHLDINELFDFREMSMARAYGASSYFAWRVNRVWRFRR